MTLTDPTTQPADAAAPTTVRLTTAQALVRWMVAQRSELLDGTRVPLFAGVFGIFGHGNVLGLGTALHAARDDLPTWRGQNEQGMALAAVGYAKAMDRRQVMVATSSIGPGALNMVTAAGLAMANRLPVLLLPGDTFTGRGPDPVLQQVEHYGDPTTTANDAFRAVSRYYDRITRPEQLLATLPQVARVLTDPADCGPVVLALPQDVQAEEFDFPVGMFAERVHRVPRPRPDRRGARRGGRGSCARRAARSSSPAAVRATRAPGPALLAFAEAHGVPVVETPAGRTLVPHDHPLHGGALGIIGATSANTLAGEADVVLAVGTRLQDFTTASWTVFGAGRPPRQRRTPPASTPSSTPRTPSSATPARPCSSCDGALDGWVVDPAWTARAAAERGALGRARRHAAGRGRARRRRSRTRRCSASSTTRARRPTTCSSPPAASPARSTAAGGPSFRRRRGRRHASSAPRCRPRSRRDDGPRVRLLVHGLRGRRARGARRSPGRRPTRTASSRPCSATARTSCSTPSCTRRRSRGTRSSRSSATTAATR